MTSLEFYELLDRWSETPEYKEYEDLCLSCNTLRKQIEHGAEVIELFNKAMNNEYGKQLANEPKFLEMFYRG